MKEQDNGRTEELSSATWQFIVSHREDDVRTLALQARKYPQVDMAEAVTQIAGWQIAVRKIPSWAATEGILYSRHLSMEQCSSEITALYKASLVGGESFTDLTAGLGVDCSFLARRFRRADYVERQETLCRLAAHNFLYWGLIIFRFTMQMLWSICGRWSLWTACFLIRPAGTVMEVKLLPLQNVNRMSVPWNPYW